MSEPSDKNRLEFPPGGERIAKYLARAGICSRRDAEKLIEEGRVQVDGTRLTTPAFKVASGNLIRVDGKEVQKPEETRVWRYHKPEGLVTTAKDPEGRPTVFDKLPSDLPRVISVGRLDIASEGLLLLTNDGELARQLELPATGWLRRYRVRARGNVSDGVIAKLKSGIEVDGVRYGEMNVSRDEQSSGGTNQWLTIGLREGKNREIRRVLGAVDVEVNRLIRLSYGPFELADLPPGAVQEVPGRVLRDQMGRGPKAEMADDGTVRQPPRPRKPATWAKAKPRDKPKPNKPRLNKPARTKPGPTKPGPTKGKPSAHRRRNP
ncbi:pseudouridine synthase [Pyruvatibacter sp.]|uniref:pseudouridine synthase n=1 Tax=Pyruvatibacter sp. TaxID=1981328 RepID=UPI0032EAF1DA